MKKILLLLILFMLATSIQAQWSSGNDMAIILDWHYSASNGDYVFFYSSEGGEGTTLPMLIVVEGGVTDTFYVATDSADVAWLDGEGTYMYPTYDSIKVGKDNNLAKSDAGFIFNNITYTLGTSVTSATLQLTIKSIIDTVIYNVFGEDSGACGRVFLDRNDCIARKANLTTATIADSVGSTDDSPEDKRSLDVTDIINEILAIGYTPPASGQVIIIQ